MGSVEPSVSAGFLYLAKGETEIFDVVIPSADFRLRHVHFQAHLTFDEGGQ